MAGYSPTPLARKLGYKGGFRVYLHEPPGDYEDALEPLPDSIDFVGEAKGANLVHLFTRSRDELALLLPMLMEQIDPDGMIWVSWPKKASKVATDVTEDTIRQVCLPLGLVDIKVCAVDDTWSGLKLVIRKELRRNFR